MPSSPATVPASLGTPDYIPSLLSRIRSAHPTLPLDPVVLQTLLLCLIAHTPHFATAYDAQGCAGHLERPSGERLSGGTCFNLILRTREEDIGLLVHVVSLILTTAFGVPTHKYKFPPQHRQDPRTKSPQAVQLNEQLRALFFRRPSTSQHNSRSSNGSRSSSKHAQPPRRSTVPSPSPLHTSTVLEPEHTEMWADSRDYFSDNASMASSRRPLHMFSSPTSTMRSRKSWRPRPDRLRTDPQPLSTIFSPLHAAEGSIPDSIPGIGTSAEDPRGLLPKAIVVSGLEYAGVPVQRALLQVLAERRLVLENDEDDEDLVDRREEGTWNLPDDFLMVYVCKWDPYERPGVLVGLLDKFAMSADVALTLPTRQAYAAHRTSSPFPPTSTSPPPTPRPPSIPITPLTPPAVPPAELALLRALAAPHAHAHAIAHTALRASLHTYLRDLFAATRHHPALAGALTRRAHADADALARALRVIAGDGGGAALVRVAAAERGGAGAGESSSQSVSVSASAEGSAWEKDALGMGWGEELERGGKQWGVPDGAVRVALDVSGADADGAEYAQELEEQDVGDARGGAPLEVWDVSEVDVARVFPRVVSHRLRVRDGPDDEVLGSVMWPAIRPNTVGAGRVWERKTVKDILVEILADV
ncbi:hypothetical protein B0H21DRAFT_843290 [Amylocystis lapponica]|nr:hypothetical protein B0H21DRAFT_843290 [Amylocystis lapponica]